MPTLPVYNMDGESNRRNYPGGFGFWDQSESSPSSLAIVRHLAAARKVQPKLKNRVEVRGEEKTWRQGKRPGRPGTGSRRSPSGLAGVWFPPTPGFSLKMPKKHGVRP